MKKKNIILGIALLAMTMLLTGCAKTEVDLSNYISIKVSGYNTVGTAEVEFDLEDLAEEYMDNFNLSMSDDDEEWEEVFEELASGIELSLDNDSKLSNDDRVTCEVQISEASAKKWAKDYKIVFTYEETVDKKVKGLEELTAFNPFDRVAVHYEGYSGEGYLEVNDRFSNALSLRFAISKAEGLSNGETVTISALPPEDVDKDIYEYCAGYGMYPEEISYEYTIRNLDEYSERDPFDALSKVEFVGNNGSGTAELYTTWWSDYSFVIDKSEGLSNGDKVTVSVVVPEGRTEATIEEYAKSQGEKLISTTKVFTVEGLYNYAKKLEEIPEEALIAMEEAAQNTMQNYVNNDWNNNSYYHGMNLEGYCMRTKVGENYGANTYLIYKVEADDYEDVPIEDYYIYVSFGVIDMEKKGADVVDIATAALPYGYAGWFTREGAIFEINGYIYKGYLGLESLLESLQEDTTYTYEISMLETEALEATETTEN